MIDEYTVSMWYFPERNNETWTGLFGRGTGGADGRIHSIWQGDSSHGTRPYLHHRFGEGTNWNEGVENFLYYLDGKNGIILFSLTRG